MTSRAAELLQQGMTFHSKKQLIEAEACYKEVLKIDPENADAIYLLGLLAEAIGDRNLAVDLVTHAISILPTNPLFHSALATLLKSQGKTDLAIGHYLDALKLDQNHAESIMGLSNIYHELGKLEEAIPLYRKYHAIKPDDQAGKESLAHALFNHGQILENQGLGDKAILCYKEALFLSPNITQCRDRLDLLISAPRNSLDNRLKRGLQFHLNGQYSQAAECYKEAVAGDPSNALALELRDLANDALEDVQLIHELHNSAAPGYTGTSEITSANALISNLKLDLIERKNEIIRLNDKIRVIEAQLQALVKSSSKWNFSQALQLAESLQKSNRLEEALGIEELVLDLHPQNTSAIALFMDLGAMYHQRHDLNVAENIYKKILEKDSTNPKAMHLLGMIYGQRDHYAESLELIEKSIKHAANIPPHFFKNAGQMAEKLRDLSKAEDYFRKALSKDRNYPEAYLCLSNLLENQGRSSEAEQCLLQGLESLPDNAELANQLQYLNYKARTLARAEIP